MVEKEELESTERGDGDTLLEISLWMRKKALYAFKRAILKNYCSCSSKTSNEYCYWSINTRNLLSSLYVDYDENKLIP